MLWGFDVNKMNIWHVYAYIWCPIVKKIGYKLKNEDQVQSLGAILTSPRWKLHTQMPTVHTHTHTHAHRHRNSPCSYVSFNKPHLSPSASPTSSAGPQSSAVTSPASVRLVEVCFLLSPAKRVPINFLLMYFCHIFKKVVRVFIERPQ